MTGLDKDAAVARAQHLLCDKRYADALQVCNDALARGADDAELRLVAAQSLLAQGRQEGAKKEALQAVRLDGSLAEAHRVLAEIACTRGELALGRDHLNRVLELDPDDSKSRALLESLSRPVGARTGGPGFPRKEESATFELSADDLEEEDVEAAAAPDDGHVDPFSGESFPLKAAEALVASGEMPVTDSMVMEMPLNVESGGPDRGLKTLTEVRSSDSFFEKPTRPSSEIQTTLPLPPPPGGPKEMPLFDAGPTVLTPPSAAMLADTAVASGVEDAWKPPMDAGVGGGRKYEGTLRLPALDELPEEEDAPTMPLLRPSGPPKPQLRLDPMASSPIEEQPRGWRGSIQAAGAEELAGRGGPRAERPPEPAAAAGRRGLLSDHEDSAFEEFAVEPASVPLPRAEPQSIPRDIADPVKARQELARQRGREAPEPSSTEEDAGDLLSLLSGGARGDASVPDRSPPQRQHRPTGPVPSELRARAGSGRQRAISEDPSDGDGLLGQLGAPGPGRALTPDDIERQIAAATSGAPLVETGEQPARSRGRAAKRASGGGQLRWVVVALVGLLLGGGGLAGYLYYQSWKFVRKELGVLREEVHRSTPDGYRAARAAAERVLQRRKNDARALAAMAMCDAAMALEFGDDRLKSVRELLERTKGSDSEWRTAAHAFLALMDDPMRAEGYLVKGLEVYPESAILHYLRGRALAASDAPEKAAEAFKAALKLAPKYVAARIALVALEGQSPSAYAEAMRALDDIVAADKDCVQALIERARLRARHGKDLEEAAADARRVTGDLSSKAGHGQVGWAHLVLAQVEALAEGKKDKARWAAVGEELDAAIKTPPCCEAAFRHELAGELMKVFRMAEAQAQMKEALALKPKQAEYLQRMARVLIELDDPAAALVQLQAAPARHPETKLLTGRALLAQTSYVKAAEAFKAVLADSKDNLEAAVYFELTRARRGAAGEAAAALEKLAEQNPREPRVWKALGRLHVVGGELTKAEAALKAAWKLTKIDPAVPTLLGRLSLRRHDIEAARRRFGRALEIRRDHRPARIGMALLFIATGNLPEARKQAELISAAERQKADARALEVELCLAEGKLDAARTALGEAESAGLGAAALQRLTGALALAKKQGKVAEEALKKALKLGGKEIRDGDLLVMVGRAELLSNKLDEAYDTFQVALKDDPGHPVALLEMARIEVKDDEHALAVRRLTEALGKMKERQYPSSALSTVHAALGAAYLKHKDTGHAMTSLQDAMELDGTAAEPQLLMAQTYDVLNHPQRAIQHYQKALELDASRTEINELLGRAYAKTGDAANAAKFYEEYLRSNPPPVKARAVQQELKKLQSQ